MNDKYENELFSHKKISPLLIGAICAAAIAAIFSLFYFYYEPYEIDELIFGFSFSSFIDLGSYDYPLAYIVISCFTVVIKFVSTIFFVFAAVQILRNKKAIVFLILGAVFLLLFVVCGSLSNFAYFLYYDLDDIIEIISSNIPGMLFQLLLAILTCLIFFLGHYGKAGAKIAVTILAGVLVIISMICAVYGIYPFASGDGFQDGAYYYLYVSTLVFWIALWACGIMLAWGTPVKNVEAVQTVSGAFERTAVRPSVKEIQDVQADVVNNKQCESANDVVEERSEHANKQRTSAYDTLRELKLLLDEGVLTQEEFDEQKRKLLDTL